ncbi:MerR family DNA-binding transcriptional regulator [Brevibacterium yomogidense]|nr:MerR family DNA-binding transcriptional regulator [Brevibacterium yomogidense]
MQLAIGTAAAEVGIAVSTLRYWERQGLITPRRQPGEERR